MNKKIKFSIIMPFYNSGEYIERAILSVISQTYLNWELIAVNDGSTDNSLCILEKYCKNDSRIRIISKENGGYSTAINAGLDSLSSDSDYFMLLGSDDELYDNLLSLIAIKLDNFLFDLIGFRTTIINNDSTEFLEKYSSFTNDISENNCTINDFCNKHNDLPELFAIRDTSKCYKTSLLGNLRYFGKFGVAADGIFSMLFSYKCHSFACFAIDGYKWHLRNDSVSQKKFTPSIKEDIFLNWLSFYQIALDNKYVLTSKSIEYINFFIDSFLEILSIQERAIYERNKDNCLKSRDLILKLIKDYNVGVSFGCLLRIKHQHIFNIYYLVKFHNKHFMRDRGE